MTSPVQRAASPRKLVGWGVYPMGGPKLGWLGRVRPALCKTGVGNLVTPPGAVEYCTAQWWDSRGIERVFACMVALVVIHSPACLPACVRTNELRSTVAVVGTQRLLH